MKLIIDIPKKWFNDMKREEFIKVDELCEIILHSTLLEKHDTELLDKMSQGDYKRAFYIACALLNGAYFYGIDADKIFEICMDKDGVVTEYSYRDYILNHLDEIDHGEYKTKGEIK